MNIIHWVLLIPIFTAGVGWVMNIVKLVGMLGGDITAMFIARIVGVAIAPLGAVLGFM